MKRRQIKLLLHIGAALAIAWSMVATMAPPARAGMYITLDPKYGKPGDDVTASGAFTRSEDDRFCGMSLYFGDTKIFDEGVGTHGTCLKKKWKRYSFPFKVPTDAKNGKHQVTFRILFRNVRTGEYRWEIATTPFTVGEPPPVNCETDAKPDPDMRPQLRAQVSGKVDCGTPGGGDARAPAAAEANASETRADAQTDPEADRQ